MTDHFLLFLIVTLIAVDVVSSLRERKAKQSLSEYERRHDRDRRYITALQDETDRLRDVLKTNGVTGEHRRIEY